MAMREWFPFMRSPGVLVRSGSLVAAAAVSLAGCGSLPSGLSGTSFDPQEVAWAAKPGKNTLRGRAVMRPPGGEMRTCAGASVAAVPDSAYARQRMNSLYGSVERGMNDLSYGAARTIEPADPGFAKAARVSTCDIHGGFAFRGLADGTWYVTTSVVWRTKGNDPKSQAGAALMQRVTLQGGQTVSVMLAPQPGD
jgi:hypothetical protein